MPNMLCPQCWGRKTSCAYCGKSGVVPDVRLSPHFTLSELVASQTAARKKIANVPTDDHRAHLTRLALECLEPIRLQFGPLHVNSGLRVAKLNKAIGGSTTSAHCAGWAADLVPIRAGITLKRIVDWVIGSSVPYDQIIYEGTWVHIARFNASGTKTRKQKLMMFGGKYAQYDATDPRVI
jgi:hypothetical protein